MVKEDHFYAVNTDVTDYPYYAEKWDGFYAKPDDSIDVLFLGSSVIHTNIDPNYMYAKYGFTSYDLSSDQQSGVSTYYFLKEALKTQHPKVVVIDVQSLYHPRLENKISNHYGYDFMKNGINKICGITDIYGADVEEMLFPLTKYHNRWEELAETDFEYLSKADQPEFNGHLCYMWENQQSEPTRYKKSELALEDIGFADTKELLDKLVDTCDKKDITCVLLRTPTVFTYYDSKYCDAIQSYANERDVVFFNCNDIYDDIGVDFETDYVDTAHMNQAGAERLSGYIGKLLSENNKLPDHRGQSGFEDWENAYYEETYLIHDFDIRHYDTASDFMENGDYTSNQLLLIYTYNRKEDFEKLKDQIPDVLLEEQHENAKSKSVIWYNGDIHYFINQSTTEMYEIDSIDVSILHETLKNGNRIWIDDEYIDTIESNGIVDLIIYDVSLGKILDHININVMSDQRLTHLLNPY